MKKIRGLRWWVAALLLGAAVLNYIDRQTLSALAPTIQQDLGFDDREYANIVSLFLVAYTFSYLVSGRLADWLGTRRAMGLFVGWWSVADALTAAAVGLRSLGVFRFALGLGEAGIWPTAPKAVAEWFPARERGLAVGLYTMGATIGATVAPYLVIPLALYPVASRWPALGALLGHGAGWRLAFIVTGALGALWLIPWLLLYRAPRDSRRITPEELALVTAEEAGGAAGVGAPWTWRQILSSRVVWLLLLGRLLTDPVWYFYQFWFPKYLHSARHLSQGELTVTWIVYAAAGAGSLVGGWAAAPLIRRGLAPAVARLWVMLGCAALLPISPLIAATSGLDAALVLTVVVVFAALAWLINISAIVVDVIPAHSLGTVFGFVAAGSTVGGVIMNTVVAAMVSGAAPVAPGFVDRAVDAVCGGLLQMVQGAGYERWFVVMAFLHPLAWLLLRLGGVHRAGERGTAVAPAPIPVDEER